MSTTQTIPRDFLTALVQKEFINEGQVEQILGDGDLVQFFEKAKKTNKKKSSEERAGEYNPDKCSARIWKDGYDNIQCSAAKGEGGCFCKRHQKKFTENGSWWLGKIEDPRPKNPIHPTAGEHFWRTDEDGNEIVKPKKSPKKSDTTGKKKRGRPAGSKNKKKKVTPTEMSKEELLALIAAKEAEEKETESKGEVKKSEDEGEEGGKGAGVFEEKDVIMAELVEDSKEKKADEEADEEEKKYELDGIEYMMDDEGNVMDQDDFTLIGTITDGEFEFDDEGEEKHKGNVKNKEN
ncbi:MAG: hypothetical protein CMG46_00610 [Candidatus Marinimicrobia bacterium]|nr:hypothetical protein [Candidatus Neomarinimicrobiota bacterium]